MNHRWKTINARGSQTQQCVRCGVIRKKVTVQTNNNNINTRKMAKKITTLSAPEAREFAIEIGSEAKKTHKNLTPYRVDKNTIILVKSKDQINSFIDRLEKFRNNY